MVPLPIKVAIENHVKKGQPCGSFTTAVLENDLTEAVGHADEQSMANLREIVQYCYNKIPSPCWGSKKKVKEWREKGGDANAYIED